MKLAITLMITILLATVANAATQIGIYDCGGTPGLEIYTGKAINQKVGMFAYGYVSKDWSEAYVGPSFNPTKNSEILLGVGMEQGQDALRFGGWSDVTFGRTTFEYDYEFGGSGYFYKLKADYRLTPKLDVAAIDKKSAGLGLSARYQLVPGVKLRVECYKESTQLATFVSF